MQVVKHILEKVVEMFDDFHIAHSLSLESPEGLTSMYFPEGKVLSTASDPLKAKEMIQLRNANSVRKWQDLCKLNPTFISFAKLGLKMMNKKSNVRTYHLLDNLVKSAVDQAED